MPSVVGRATAADGTALLTRHWAATEAAAGGAWSGAPWASVLLVHGLGEHSGRYEHVGDRLVGAGLDVYAYDYRGNGGSDGERGHVEDWSDYHNDLAERLEYVRQASGTRPVAMYGHSMGGLVVAGYLLTERPQPDLAVLTAPGLDSTLATWKKALAPLVSRLAPHLAVSTGIDGATLSRDPSVGERTAVDPLCVKTCTARFGAEALSEQARVRAGAAAITVPTLVLHGLDDGLVPARASEVLATSPAVERRTYPGLRHELHNEPEGPQVVDDIIEWLRAKGEAMPSGPAVAVRAGPM